MLYTELKEDDYTSLRRDLIKEKGSKLQREFLYSVRESRRFLEFIEQEIASSDGEKTLPLYQGCLSDNEFKDPPKNIENEVFDLWRGIVPSIACRTSFWGGVTVTHIKAGIIESHYLAKKGGMEGIACIEEAVDGEDKKKIDRVVRDVLRAMGGLPEARGNRSVIVDCFFSRMWWRKYLAEEVCSETNSASDKVSKLFRTSKTYWEKLITFTVSRVSVLGDSRVRSILISCLANINDDSFHVSANLTRLIRMLGTKQAIQELAVWEDNELKQMINEELIPQIASDGS